MPRVRSVSIRCRARRTAQRSSSRGPTCVWTAASIRCRARRTAQPRRGGLSLTAALGAVSIRCRARRTAQQQQEGGRRGLPGGFYSLSCETYSATRLWFGWLIDGNVNVSIRCRARRTAQRRAPRGSIRTVSFYSLSCETYSATGADTIFSGCTSFDKFLFAVVRDVQRNVARHHLRGDRRLSVSIRCRARRTAQPVTPVSPPKTTRGKFLFAVVRDVQRNQGRHPRQGGQEVSIRCRARRTAQLEVLFAITGTGGVSIRCRARRTAQRRFDRPRGDGHRHVSIRCRARRTAQRDSAHGALLRRRFLFAVVRDVQRNKSVPADQQAADIPGFYSLSCETYSATVTVYTYFEGDSEPFLFAVVRDVQRNFSRGSRSRTPTRFLFAVVRDVQRNGRVRPLDRGRRARFYSLSCETYSAT